MPFSGGTLGMASQLTGGLERRLQSFHWLPLGQEPNTVPHNSHTVLTQTATPQTNKALAIHFPIETK